MPDFNDANKLGTGKEMVDRLTNLIAIFENKSLDFSRNRADESVSPLTLCGQVVTAGERGIAQNE